MEHVPAKPEDVHCCGMGLGNNPHSAEPELRVAPSFCEEQSQTHASSEESFGDYCDRTNTPYFNLVLRVKKKNYVVSARHCKTSLVECVDCSSTSRESQNIGCSYESALPVGLLELHT